MGSSPEDAIEVAGQGEGGRLGLQAAIDPEVGLRQDVLDPEALRQGGDHPLDRFADPIQGLLPGTGERAPAVPLPHQQGEAQALLRPADELRDWSSRCPAPRSGRPTPGPSSTHSSR